MFVYPYYPMIRFQRPTQAPVTTAPPAKLPIVKRPMADQDGEDEMDMAYMTKMYSQICKEIHHFVVRICDGMETKDSCLYHEYPDIATYQMLVEKIYDMMKKDGKVPRVPGIYEGARDYQGDLFRDLIGAVLLAEVFGNRRRRHRRRYRPHPSYPYGGGYYPPMYTY